MANKLACLFCGNKVPAAEPACRHCRKSALRSVAGRFDLVDTLRITTDSVAYRGIDRVSGNAVFVRVLRPGAPEETRAALANEARLQKRLDGTPALPSFIAAGRIPGVPTFYSVSEFVGGVPLNRALRRARPIDVLDTCQALMKAVEPVHAEGLVLCTLNPRHVRVMETGEIIILDLRLARSSGETGKGHGVPGYRAPEQYHRRCLVTPQTDVFALGCMMYKALTGVSPFKIPFLESSPRFDAPLPPSARNKGLGSDVDDVILKAISVRPGDRYANAGELEGALADRLGETTITDGRALPEFPSGVVRVQTLVLAGWAISLVVAAFMVARFAVREIHARFVDVVPSVARPERVVGDSALLESPAMLDGTTLPQAVRTNEFNLIYDQDRNGRSTALSTASERLVEHLGIPEFPAQQGATPFWRQTYEIHEVVAQDQDAWLTELPAAPDIIPSQTYSDASADEVKVYAPVKFLAYPPVRMRIGEFISEVPNSSWVMVEPGQYPITIVTKDAQIFEQRITVEPVKKQIFKIYGNQQRIVRSFQP